MSGSNAAQTPLLRTEFFMVFLEKNERAKGRGKTSNFAVNWRQEETEIIMEFFKDPDFKNPRPLLSPQQEALQYKEASRYFWEAAAKNPELVGELLERIGYKPEKKKGKGKRKKSK